MKEQQATWTFTYSFEGSDWFEWETAITPEEEKIINESIQNGIPLDDVSALVPVIDRVYDEISKECSFEDEYCDENEDCCEGLVVHFHDPNNPFYMQ